MKNLLLIFTLLFTSVFLSPNVVLSETMNDLVKRNGIHYKKFSEVRFNGKTTGLEQGTIKNGKKEGEWTSYWKNGGSRSKGNYKNGKKEGRWVGFYENGQLNYKVLYKNGNKDSSVSYHDNGQLWARGAFKNNKREGDWVQYNEDGTLNGFRTGTYKNGNGILWPEFLKN